MALSNALMGWQLPLKETLWPSHGVRVACGKGLENMSKPIWVPWLPMWVEGVRKLSCLNRKSAMIRVQMIWETTIVPAFSITIPLYETMKQKQLLQVMRVMLPISQIFCVLPSDTKQRETKNRKPQLRYMTSNWKMCSYLSLLWHCLASTSLI